MITYLPFAASMPAANAANPAGEGAAAANLPPGGGAVGAPASAMPRGKLLNDDERFRSLLSQVHGRGGKESAELRALFEGANYGHVATLLPKKESIMPDPPAGPRHE